jgi:hypothetical protein
MTSEQHVPDEPFAESMLSPAPLSLSDALKDSVFQLTRAKFRRRQRLRVAARLGLLAACFLGGMGVMMLVNARLMPENRTIIVYVPQESKPREAQASPEPKRAVTPSELELEAEASLVKTESARRFREAGDRYLREEANYQAALRCYRNYLDETEEASPAVSESDTWLLTSLVNARRKETANVQFDR